MDRPDSERETPAAAVPSYYFNGFQLGLSNSDINAVFSLGNVPAVALNMSYTTAKTLSLALQDMIASLEKVTAREIMTTAQVGQGLDQLSSAQEVTDGNVH